MVQAKQVLLNKSNHSLLQLGTNINPYGPSPAALLKAHDALKNVHHYPELSYNELKLALANFLTLSPCQLVVGNGSEYILELIVKTFLSKDQSAMLAQYAFHTIPFLLNQYQINQQIVSARNFGHDLNKMITAIQETTRAIFLVNPNNPTGTHFTRMEWDRFIQQVPKHILVILDEAYYEYMATEDYPDSTNYLSSNANLIIVRTFSKAYGLAGLRLGYAITSRGLAAQLESARLPYPVNSVAALVATAALSDQAHLHQVMTSNALCRQQLIQGLAHLQFSTLPAPANFISMDVGDAYLTYEALLKAGVVVKTLHEYKMPRHIRITVGTPPQNEYFLGILEKVASYVALR